jgi:hypothetical protein
MINYKSEKQLSTFDLKTGFESKLDSNNMGTLMLIN